MNIDTGKVYEGEEVAQAEARGERLVPISKGGRATHQGRPRCPGPAASQRAEGRSEASRPRAHGEGVAQGEPPMRLMAEAWMSYRESVVPANAGPTQVVESRRAFYAGAECLLVGVMKMLDPGTEPTDADLARMESLHAELLAFAKDVAEGRA